MTNMPIGRLAKATNVKVPTIRFYEQIGLLPAPQRTESDRRVYGEAAVKRLAFIKHARQLGFSVEAIRDLLDLSDHPHRPCEQANRLAAEQLEAVDEKIAQLSVLKTELERMVGAGCAGEVADCRVIEALADPTLCDHHRPGFAGRAG
ncbi:MULTISPECIES: helix-turn-helix domain-containing protein [unclassified Phenylobacterium]|jgi:DNA-binding transcriptional MerR regulator|uniref:MerR family transcriptional regulator n=1 Tax=unclassified Phenylobacterium TaxID=2640670 RepID=UPI0009E9998D|nr:MULTISPECIES: helix-turn-helix domain-containing protein [unclassified Phenylobacterium]